MSVELAEAPVLPDTVVLRVREQLSDEERTALETTTGAAATRTPTEPVVISEDPRFPGSWVLWRRVDSLLGQRADARVYVLESSTGRVRFGDARHGKIPPAGRDGIRAFRYQQGDGEAGNVAAWSNVKVVSAVEGLDTVVVPVEAAGGFGGPADTSSAILTARKSLLARAPHLVRHAGRALTPADIEALVVGSSAEIVRAHCARSTGPEEPMRVTIAVRNGSRCPVPTMAQREAVAALIRRAGWGGLGDASVEVNAPTYVGLALRVHLVATKGAQAELEHAAKETLNTLLHPVEGGPDGSGWPFGYGPTPSDLLRALHGASGLDHVGSIDITAPDGRPLDQLPVDGLACADTADIAVIVTSLEVPG